MLEARAMAGSRVGDVEVVFLGQQNRQTGVEGEK